MSKTTPTTIAGYHTLSSIQGRLSGLREERLNLERKGDIHGVSLVDHELRLYEAARDTAQEEITARALAAVS